MPPQSKLKKNQQLKNIYFRQSSNKGKDIGGKMVLLDTYLKLNIVATYFVAFKIKN